LNEAHAVIAGSLVGFLPSPPSNVLHLGPLTLHMYGLMLLAGIVAPWQLRRFAVINLKMIAMIRLSHASRSSH
jgi:prolipoprotein diacylglyceryltransferase